MQTIKHTRIIKKVATYKVAYRIESKIDGIGPYQHMEDIDSKFWEKFGEKMLVADEQHPTPEGEGYNPFYVMRCLCGCRTVEQLKQWFGEFYTPLLENEGFQLIKYIIRKDGIKYTKHQVLIEPEKVIKKVVIEKH